VKGTLIVALGIVFGTALLIGCDSKPTPVSAPAAPPVGHQNFSKAERFPKATTPTPAPTEPKP
jgi:hypothetical protein